MNNLFFIEKKLVFYYSIFYFVFIYYVFVYFMKFFCIGFFKMELKIKYSKYK